jgi:hypothetical protein
MRLLVGGRRAVVHLRCGELEKRSGWRPRRDAAQILADIHAWIHEHERDLAQAL